jgi:hypothetical protein
LSLWLKMPKKAPYQPGDLFRLTKSIGAIRLDPECHMNISGGQIIMLVSMGKKILPFKTIKNKSYAYGGNYYFTDVVLYNGILIATSILGALEINAIVQIKL